MQTRSQVQARLSKSQYLTADKQTLDLFLTDMVCMLLLRVSVLFHDRFFSSGTSASCALLSRAEKHFNVPRVSVVSE